MQTRATASFHALKKVDFTTSARARLRAAIRFWGFLALLGIAAIEWAVTPRAISPARERQARAEWLQRLCRRILRLLNIQVTYRGGPPRRGLLVSNHLSYLDIVILGAKHPSAFLSKREVAGWPLIGRIARMGGTLFIDREQRRDVLRAGDELAAAVRHDVPVCVFAEGTSSNGADVLPFRPSLFQAAVDHGWHITPARITYALPEGNDAVAEEVCYWRDLTFLPHFLNLLSKEAIIARVSYGRPLFARDDRKQLAERTRAEVRGLGQFRSWAGQVEK